MHTGRHRTYVGDPNSHRQHGGARQSDNFCWDCYTAVRTTPTHHTSTTRHSVSHAKNNSRLAGHQLRTTSRAPAQVMRPHVRACPSGRRVTKVALVTSSRSASPSNNLRKTCQARRRECSGTHTAREAAAGRHTASHTGGTNLCHDGLVDIDRCVIECDAADLPKFHAAVAEHHNRA